MIKIYTRLYGNDPYTTKGELDYGGFYGKVKLDMFIMALSELNSYGQKTLSRLLKLLNDENKELIGTQGFRGIIPKSQSELARILSIDRRYLNKGIKNLEKHNIVKYNNGMLMVNPLVFNQHSIFDIRVLQAFNLKLKDTPTNNNIKVINGSVTNIKADISTKSKEGF